MGSERLTSFAGNNSSTETAGPVRPRGMRGTPLTDPEKDRMTSIQPGDIVRLKGTTTPEMTVTLVGDQAECAWDGVSQRFDVAELERVRSAAEHATAIAEAAAAATKAEADKVEAQRAEAEKAHADAQAEHERRKAANDAGIAEAKTRSEQAFAAQVDRLRAENVERAQNEKPSA